MAHAPAHHLVEEYSTGNVIDGKYRLLRPLGEGGMGSVWAAHSLALDVPVAIKLIRMDRADEDSAKRLQREARAMARLADPGIVRVFDVSHTEHGEPYIAMELLVGATLRDVMDTGPVNAVRAIRLLLPIVRALDCAHRAGVVHRDLKPENIVLAQGARGDLQPKLLDFGVAKLVQSVDNLTRVGTVMGSPLHMSPEQARGEAVDHRTDLWSVCAVLYEAVAGQPPFHAENTNALLHAISTQEARDASDAFEPALWSIVRRGLAKDLGARWQDARDLMLELASWLRARGATEDITGTALSGRGVGCYSSMPALSSSESRPRASATQVIAAHAAAPRAKLRAPPSPVQNDNRGWPLLLEKGYRSPRFWAVIAALLLLSLLVGRVLQQPAEPLRSDSARSAPSALPPTRPLVDPSPLPAPSDDQRAEDAPAPAAPNRLSNTPAAAPPRTRERASPPRGSSRAAKPPAPTRPAPPSQPAPFKNPFD